MAKLKPMSHDEVLDVAKELSTWVGAQFQEIFVDGIDEPRSLYLGFFWTGGVRWIVFDYTVQAPQILLFDGDGVPMTPPKPVKMRRPIELFVRSRFLGKRLVAVHKRENELRAFDLIFDNEKKLRLEFNIAPHGRNVVAIADDKRLSEFKPLEAKGEVVRREVEAARARKVIVNGWLESRRGASRPAVSNVETGDDTLKRPKEHAQLKKKRSALEKVLAELERKRGSPARKLGEWLKENQTLDLPAEWPEEWKNLIDRDWSLADNIQRLFVLAKNQERKVAGNRERAKELEAEIAKLERMTPDDAAQSERRKSLAGQSSGARDLFQVAGARGRKTQIAEDLTVYIGKNAAENLAILRKAQPFDYWLHLRDRPGSHAIIRRTRGRNVTDAEFILAAIPLIEQTLKKRALELSGEAFDMLIVECRFVRPIKGDNLGRVHYSGERVLRISL